MKRLQVIYNAVLGRYDELIEYGNPSDWAIEEDLKGEHIIYTGYTADGSEVN